MTVADLKRRLQPGVELTLVRIPYARPDKVALLPLTRKIVAVQTNGVYFEGSEFSRGERSWLAFPKAAELSATEKGFRINYRDDGAECLEYEWR